MFNKQLSIFGITPNQKLETIESVDIRFYESARFGPGLLKLSDSTTSKIRPWDIYFVDRKVAQVIGPALKIGDDTVDFETSKQRLLQILPALRECDITSDAFELETADVSLSITICDHANQYTLVDSALMSLWVQRLKPTVSRETWLKTGIFYEES